MDHEPVTAGPPGRLYRLGKFLRRHRQAAVLTGLVVVLLTGGLISTLVMYLRTEEKRREVDFQRARGEEAEKFEYLANQSREYLSKIMEDS